MFFHKKTSVDFHPTWWVCFYLTFLEPLGQRARPGQGRGPQSCEAWPWAAFWLFLRLWGLIVTKHAKNHPKNHPKIIQNRESMDSHGLENHVAGLLDSGGFGMIRGPVPFMILKCLEGAQRASLWPHEIIHNWNV